MTNVLLEIYYGGLFLVVLSPASLIVIIIVELVESGFFKKSL